MPTSPSRRAVLAALSASAAVALAGCSTPWGRLRVQPLGGDPPPTTPPPGPDELAVRATADAVTAALDQVGALDAPLAGPLRTALGEQLVALGEPAPSATSSTTSSSTTTTGPSQSAAPEPTGAAATATAAAAVQTVAQLLADAAGTASSDLADVAGGTARLLACAAAGLDVAAGWVAGSTGAAPAGAAASSSRQSASSSASSSGSSAGPTAAAASPTAAAQSGEQGALADALAVEEAAQYGYGVLAVRLTGAQRDAAVADLATHTDLVERLRDDLESLGAAPPAPRPAWALPSPVTDAAGALALAQQLEEASAAAWADVVAAAARQRRAAAAEELRLAAQRWQAWRAAAGGPGLVALPGLSGR